jgi:hypothetical protein
LRRTLAVLLIAAVAACAPSTPEGSETPRPTGPAASPTATAATSTGPADAFSLMEAEFAGSPSRAEIKPLFDEVLAIYEPGAPLTDDLYRRAAGTLIDLRTTAVDNGCPETTCSEMAILREMARQRLAGRNFPAAARQVSDALAAGG